MQSVTSGDWHLARGGQTYGSYTWQQVVEHTRGGRIGRGDKLFDPRTGAWTKPYKVPGLLGPGGAAVIPAAASVAAKIAVGIVITLAVALTSIFFWYTYLPVPFIDGGPGTGQVQSTGLLQNNVGSSLVQQADDATSTSPTVVMAPEGLTFKGTFRWETFERDAPGGRLPHESTCYLWIYTTDTGTAAYFDFGENLRKSYPVQLASHTGSNYVFRNDNSWVEIVVHVTDTSMSGTVRNTTEISAFVGGTFSGESISYDQYKAEVP